MRIALVGLASLHALGFESLIGKLWPEACVIRSDEGESEGWRDAQAFIVSASAIAAYAPFFMPRLSNVLLITSSPSLHGQILPSVSPLESEAEIVVALRKLIDETKPQPTHHPAFPGTEVSNPLTAREMDVLRLMVKGAASKEIAGVLGISVNTVLTHRKKITDKLGVHGAPALVYYAMTHKFV